MQSIFPFFRATPPTRPWAVRVGYGTLILLLLASAALYFSGLKSPPPSISLPTASAMPTTTAYTPTASDIHDQFYEQKKLSGIEVLPSQF